MRVLPRCASGRLGRQLTASAGLAVAMLSQAGLMPADAAPAKAPSPAGVTAASVRPTTAAPDQWVTFTVSCASLNTAAAMLLGQPLGLPALIAMDAAAMDGDFVVSVQLPPTVRPGRYRPRIECSDGTSAAVALRVESRQAAAAAAAAAAGERAAAATPASGVGAGLAAGGIALMAVGAVAGGSALALRRSVRAHP